MAPYLLPIAAAESEQATRSLLEIIIAGGPLLWPIVVASFVMLVVVLERMVSLRRGRVAPQPFVKCLLSQVRDGTLDRDGALDLCEENASPLARVMEAGARRWGRPSVEVEQAVLDEGERVANMLRRNLRVLSGVAQTCPLLGLFGTVWGMMSAFDAIAGESAMGRPEMLAGGISEALVTTAGGLAVAIPSLIAYLYFVGRVDCLVMEIDRRGQELVNLISAEAQQNSRSNRKKAA